MLLKDSERVGSTLTHDKMDLGTDSVSSQSLSQSPVITPSVLDSENSRSTTTMGNTMLGAPVRITLQDFADREGIPLSTARWWVSNGLAPRSYRLGRRRVMDLDDVIRWESDLKARTAR